MPKNPTPIPWTPIVVITAVGAALIPHDFGGVYSIHKSAVWLAALVWLTAGRPQRQNPPRRIATLLLLIYPWFSAFIHHGRFGYHVPDAFNFLIFFAIVSVAYRVRGALQPSHQQEIGLGLTLGALATAAWMISYAVLYGLAPTSPDHFGLGGSWGNRNLASHFLVAAWCLGRWPTGRTGLAARGLVVAAVIAGQSRAALAALLYLILQNLFAQASPRQRRHLATGGFTAALLLVCLAGSSEYGRQVGRYSFHPDRYVVALQQQPTQIAERAPLFRGKTYNLFVRLLLHRQAPDLIAAAPWLGHGPGQYRVAYPKATRGPDPNLSDTYRPHHAHNLLVEAAVLFGLPWMLLLAALLFQAWRAVPEARWRTALLLQALIALVSINYVNAYLVSLLILTAPVTPAETQSAKASLPLKCGLVAVLAAMVLLSTTSRQMQAAALIGTDTRWFAEQHARAAAQDNHTIQAWHHQRAALYQDPYGPTLRHNLATAWERLTQENPTVDPCPPLALFRDNARRFPFYRNSQTDARRLATRLSQPCNDLNPKRWESWLQQPDPVSPERGFPAPSAQP